MLLSMVVFALPPSLMKIPVAVPGAVTETDALALLSPHILFFETVTEVTGVLYTIPARVYPLVPALVRLSPLMVL